MGVWVPASPTGRGLFSLEPKSSHMEDLPSLQTYSPLWGAPLPPATLVCC